MAIWRGDPLPDLERLADFAPQVERVRQRLFDAALRLGELYITEGRGIDAAHCAERVLGVDPHLERAHRLSVAARLVDGDARGAAVAVQRLEAWLADLGVETRTGDAHPAAAGGVANGRCVERG